jgi:eukaryotic-like serine/threonine-protein kinase
MTPERWHRITELFQAAVARDPATRDAFLLDACRGDPDLRGELDALLAAHDEAGSFGKTGIFGLSQLGSMGDGAEVPGAGGRFAPGARLADRFSIVRPVGEGGMGVVYEAIDERLNRPVALKCARPGYGHRLPPEARAAREVSHFDVCKMHDLHVISTADGEIDLLSMEFVEGDTLGQRVARDGPLAPAQAREIALQIGEGLAQAHRQQVVHGDLKGANVILGRSAQGELRAVITDFGLASLKIDADGGARGGTRSYMAPELIDGERATVASDLYAFGVLLHVMLAGEPPGPGDPRARELPGIAPLPSPWKKIVTRCLQPDPRNRPASVEDAVRPLVPVRWRWKATAAVLAVAAILAVTFRPGREESPGSPVRLVVLPIGAQAGEGGPTPAGSAAVGTGVAARLTGLRRNVTVISPGEAKLNQVDTPEKSRRVLGATHVLETRVHAADGKVAMTASLVDLQSGRTVRQLSGTYPAGDSQLLTTALAGMVTEALRLPAGDPGGVLAGPAGAAYSEGMGLLRESGTNGRKAIPFFMKAVELSPRSALPYAGLAEAQLQLFDSEGGHWLDDASASVRTATNLNAASVPVLLVAGALAQQYGRYEDAIRDFRRVTELEPTNSEAWRRLASAYERTNPDEVVATYEKAIQAQPGYYRHYLSLGNFYFDHSQFDRAESMARKVTEVAPGLAAGHTNLGLALMRQGRFAEAEGSLLSALRIRESAGLLLNIGALYYAQERFEEARGYFERCLALGPPTVIRLVNLGDAYRHLGRAHDATAAYQRAMDLAEAEVARDPRRALSRVFLGMIAAQLGDRRRAEAELSQSLALEPDNSTVIRQAAIGYEALGQRDRTLTILSRAPSRLLEELSHQPDMKGLQQDARFPALLEQKNAR